MSKIVTKADFIPVMHEIITKQLALGTVMHALLVNQELYYVLKTEEENTADFALYHHSRGSVAILSLSYTPHLALILNTDSDKGLQPLSLINSLVDQAVLFAINKRVAGLYYYPENRKDQLFVMALEKFGCVKVDRSIKVDFSGMKMPLPLFRSARKRHDKYAMENTEKGEAFCDDEASISGLFQLNGRPFIVTTEKIGGSVLIALTRGFNPKFSIDCCPPSSGPSDLIWYSHQKLSVPTEAIYPIIEKAILFLVQIKRRTITLTHETYGFEAPWPIKMVEALNEYGFEYTNRSKNIMSYDFNWRRS